jgi:phage gp45-like
MKFSSARDASDRAGGGVTRHTLVKADDAHFMQEVEIQGFAGEQAQTIEHAHPYGMSAVPNDQVQGAVQAAEGFVAHLSGNRSHGVVLVMGDRRYRVMNLGKGDVCFHRDDGQQVHFTSTGTVVSAPMGKTITGQIMQSGSMPIPTQPQGASAQMGQGAQAGKPNATSFTLTSTSFTAAIGSTSLVRCDSQHATIRHKASGNVIWSDSSGCHSNVAITVASYPYSDT